MATVYVASNKYSLVTAWAATTPYSVGALRRQLATPAVGAERVFRCTTAGTSGGSEPSWFTSAGVTTTDGTCVWTEVTGQSTYNASGTWNAPHARIGNALASGWTVGGDTVRVHASHTETQATGITWNRGTAAAPAYVACVNDADTAVATTAIVTTTGASSLNCAGFLYFYGITFNLGSGLSNGSLVFDTSSPVWMRFERCTIKLVGTSSGSIIKLGRDADQQADDRQIEFWDTDVSFSNVGQSFYLSGDRFLWRGGSILVGSTAPTALFTCPVAWNADVLVSGVDLSVLTSGKSLVDVGGPNPTRLRFLDCKLGASVSLTTGSIPGMGGAEVELVNCDSADTNYRYHRQIYAGTVSHETTVVRASGASDGTTSLARKMVTTANAKVIAPLSFSIEFWNDTIGSGKTVSVAVLTDNVTLKDTEAWIDVEYLGTSGFPIASRASDRSADFIYSAGIDQTPDVSSSWTTTGLSTPIKQTLGVSFTPQEKGPIRATVYLAKASTTMYVDPLVQVT